MTTAKEQFKSDLQKDPSDLEREADGARKDLEGTVEKLMHQLSPRELINRGVEMVRNTGDVDFVRNLVNRVESNPIPTVLAGVGLIWLATASSSSKTSSHDVARRTREAGHKVAEGATDAMHRVQDGGRHTAESARNGLRSARDGYNQLLTEQPLLIGALAMAAGAALGTLLPKTSTEDRVMGDWSDKGSDAIKEKAEEKLQDLQGKSSSDSSGRDDAPASGDDSSDGKGPGPSAAPPPPTSPGTARDSGNSHRGASY